MNDTIFALSSGHGKAGIAVVRLSGVDLEKFFQMIGKKPLPRIATLADLIDTDGGVIDRAIIIYFSAPNSFTGEDVIEFHTHGSTAVIEKLFDALRARGARMADPGEFTRRAFDNGKMDLIEVDGLTALLDARTEHQRRTALRTAAGADSAVYENWRAQMIEIAAYSAAMLDYPADELPENIGKNLLERTKKLHAEISAAISRAAAGRSVRAGFNIAIIGPVNAGKSSLFNRLVGESRAIVSDVPGTTRDVVSAEIDIDGYLVRLLDTAGLRATKNKVEKMGIARTNDAIETADLVIKVENSVRKVKNSPKENEIIVRNKCDLVGPENTGKDNGFSLNISALTGVGISELLDLIRKEVHKRLDDAESDVIVNARAKTLLEEAVAELKSAIDAVPSADIFAEHVRRAADAIGRILGVIRVEEVMDAVFGQLCLGK